MPVEVSASGPECPAALRYSAEGATQGAAGCIEGPVPWPIRVRWWQSFWSTSRGHQNFLICKFCPTCSLRYIQPTVGHSGTENIAYWLSEWPLFETNGRSLSGGEAAVSKGGQEEWKARQLSQSLSVQNSAQSGQAIRLKAATRFGSIRPP